MDYQRITAVLLGRKWLILLSVVAASVFAFVGARLTGSRWQVAIRFEDNHAAAVAGILDGQNHGDELVGEAAMAAAKARAETYAAAIHSRELLQPAMSAAGIAKPPDAKDIECTAEGPHLFDVKVTAASVDQAGTMANKLADSLAERYRGQGSEDAQSALRLLEGELRGVDGRIASLRSRYDTLRTQSRMTGDVKTSVDTAVARLKTAQEKRDEAASKLAGAEVAVQDHDADLARTPAEQVVKRPDVARPGVTELGQALARAEEDLLKLRGQFQDNNIRVKQAIALRDGLKEKLSRELALQAGTKQTQPNPDLPLLRQSAMAARRERDSLRAQVAALNVSVRQAEAEIERYRSAEGELGRNAAEMAQQGEARAQLLSRVNAARLAYTAALGRNPIVVTERVSAFNPAVNAAPGRTVRLVILAALCALLATSGLFVAMDSLADVRALPRKAAASKAEPTPVAAAVPAPEPIAASAKPTVSPAVSAMMEAVEAAARAASSDVAAVQTSTLAAASAWVEQPAPTVQPKAEESKPPSAPKRQASPAPAAAQPARTPAAPSAKRDSTAELRPLKPLKPLAPAGERELPPDYRPLKPLKPVPMPASAQPPARLVPAAPSAEAAAKAEPVAAVPATAAVEALPAPAALPLEAVAPSVPAAVASEPASEPARPATQPPMERRSGADARHLEALGLVRRWEKDNRRQLGALVIASAQPGGAGSAAALQLAVTLADSGRDVILAELGEAPNEMSNLGVERLTGLTELCEGAPLDRALRRTSVARLRVIGGLDAGLYGPYAGKVGQAISALRDAPGYLLIHAHGTGGRVVGALADCADAVYVCPAGSETSDADVRVARAYLAAGANVLGSRIGVDPVCLVPPLRLVEGGASEEPASEPAALRKAS